MDETITRKIARAAKIVCKAVLWAIAKNLCQSASTTFVIRQEDPWPTASTPLEERILAIAKIGKSCSFDSGLADAAKKIFGNIANRNASDEEKAFAAKVLQILARSARFDSCRGLITSYISNM